MRTLRGLKEKDKGTVKGAGERRQTSDGKLIEVRTEADKRQREKSELDTETTAVRQGTLASL